MLPPFLRPGYLRPEYLRAGTFAVVICSWFLQPGRGLGHGRGECVQFDSHRYMVGVSGIYGAYGCG